MGSCFTSSAEARAAQETRARAAKAASREGCLIGGSGSGVGSGLVLVFLLVVLLLGRLFLQVALQGRPFQVVADGLLEGVGDGEQGGLVEQPAGEQDRAGDLAAV